MELAALLSQQIHVLENLLACLEREKAALIKEDAKTLLDIIEEKKNYMGLLDQVEKKREEIYPGLNLTRLKEAGLLTDELKEAGERIRELVKSIEELQETNQLLTRQSLLYVNKMISILKGSQKSTYDEQGKLDQEGKNTFLDQSI
ncbi:MAG: flagellar protein FlgN [Clostridiales bacterium]|jgi:flagellar biosynthesis/type III secretory pathway chaperone|nr:flagellar protein FlgN [Clostridiales bacterium]